MSRFKLSLHHPQARLTDFEWSYKDCGWGGRKRTAHLMLQRLGGELFPYPWVFSTQRTFSLDFSLILSCGQNTWYILSLQGVGGWGETASPAHSCHTSEATTDLHAGSKTVLCGALFSLLNYILLRRRLTLGPWRSWMWLTCVISGLVRENQGNYCQNNYLQGHQNNDLRASRDLETILTLPRCPLGP